MRHHRRNLDRSQLAIDPPVLQRMTDVLRHRGPDDDGFYASDTGCGPPYERMPGVALGFRRLSIIDVAGGHQPMANEDGTVWIVFNGEIYNFRDCAAGWKVPGTASAPTATPRRSSICTKTKAPTASGT